MKTITILLLFLITSSNNKAQWTNQNLVPEGNDLWSIYFVDDNTGWMVGSEGFIKKTTNAGLDWEEQNSGTMLTLKSVQFFNQNIGWICGEEGLIIKTTDGGENWVTLLSGTSEILTDLYFYDMNIGYVVGFNETILKTTNGGLNWVLQSSGITFNIYSVDFVDALLGYAVGGKDSSNFLKTTDGGNTWNKKTLIIGALNTPILNCVEFIDANIGWIGSEGQFYNHSGNVSKTTDGGETWFSTLLYRPNSNEDLTSHVELDNPLDNHKGIRSIYFRDSNNGYAVGGSKGGWWRNIFTTNDAGETWQKKYGYSEQTGLLSVFVNSSGTGWAVGYKGVIYKTDDSGSLWTQILSGPQSGYTGDWITSVCMLDDSIGWAAGYRKGIWYYPIILETTTGGKIWETNSEFDNHISGTPANIFFINKNIGWVSFYDKGSYKTTDGGNNWFPIDNRGRDKYFINQDTGWGTYAPLGVFKSTDGGITWVQKNSVSSNSIYFIDSNSGWSVGDGGNILKSTDGGENWFTKTSGTISNLNSVHFYDNNIGICVGESGTVLLTTDAGENWILQSVNTTSELNSVVFTDANNIWIAGSGGLILRTFDLGSNWNSYNGITGVDLISASFINESTGWFGGYNGTILKYQIDILPVELISFSANLTGNEVQLYWQTATEVNNYGFEIERKIDNAGWEKIGFEKGQGTTTSNMVYSFTDKGFKSGLKFNYRLKQVDFDGEYEYSKEIEVNSVPIEFSLSQNYPNPFNPTTTIRYQLPTASKVVIKIYNILGSEVMELVNEQKVAGSYEAEFDASNLSSGTYVYKIIADNFVQAKKMILLK